MSEQENEQVFQIQKVYVKDVSFESPNAPEIFTQDFKPNLSVELNVNTSELEDGVYNVGLLITATIKVDETVAFLCEVEQAGIFTLTGFSEDEMGYLLGAKCPDVLFPFARETISDLVTRGGFPQLLIEPVNFDAMYASAREKQTQKAS